MNTKIVGEIAHELLHMILVILLDVAPNDFQILLWCSRQMVVSKQSQTTAEDILVAPQMQHMHDVRHILLDPQARQVPKNVGPIGESCGPSGIGEHSSCPYCDVEPAIGPWLVLIITIR